MKEEMKDEIRKIAEDVYKLEMRRFTYDIIQSEMKNILRELEIENKLRELEMKSKLRESDIDNRLRELEMKTKKEAKLFEEIKAEKEDIELSIEDYKNDMKKENEERRILVKRCKKEIEDTIEDGILDIEASIEQKIEDAGFEIDDKIDEAKDIIEEEINKRTESVSLSDTAEKRIIGEIKNIKSQVISLMKSITDEKGDIKEINFNDCKFNNIKDVYEASNVNKDCKNDGDNKINIKTTKPKKPRRKRKCDCGAEVINLPRHRKESCVLTKNKT